MGSRLLFTLQRRTPSITQRLCFRSDQCLAAPVLNVTLCMIHTWRHAATHLCVALDSKNVCGQTRLSTLRFKTVQRKRLV
jgi:hypothetical protein